ncbi:MAG: DUF1588 domain-containing protein [Bryobacterales bacterium]
MEVNRPDPDLFPAFNGEMARAMRLETEMVFAAILRENRSILEFLDGKFTFVNERLAKHYGLEGVEGEEMRRVELDGARRGGVLTQGSVLTVSSYPTRTSAVIRGKWVLENLLNEAPPPPPPDVPALEESASAGGTMRQQLEAHRASPNCASCHARMDPLASAWRTMMPSAAGATRTAGSRIDARAYCPVESGSRRPHSSRRFCARAKIRSRPLCPKRC